jgi:predicted protein tyrosine phosphatase
MATAATVTTTKPESVKPYSFLRFIIVNYPWFKVDEAVRMIVVKLNEYAWHDPLFEILPEEFRGHGQEWLSLKKGLLIYGPVGCGKTDLMTIFNKYLWYIRSPYVYKTAVAWKYASKYTQYGPEVFYEIDNTESGNWFFDDLCLTNEENIPEKEFGYFFKSRVKVGEEIILKRYEVTSWTGYMTHFTSNNDPSDMAAIYSKQASSRLRSLCNFIPYIGRDRRETEEPHFMFNKNLKQAANIITQFDYNENNIATNDQLLQEDLARINKKLEEYRVVRNAAEIIGVVEYIILSEFLKIPELSRQVLEEKYIPAAKAKRIKQLELPATSKAEHQAKKELRRVQDGFWSVAELILVAEMAKKQCVVDYFDKLIKEGKKVCIETPINKNEHGKTV